MSDFHFKKFSIRQSNSALKVGTDAMILGALVEGKGKRLALDIGTGTGVLALMLTQKEPSLTVHAIEKEESSATDAEFNFHESHFSERLKLMKADFIDFPFSENYDLIVSNPPFYEDALLSESRSTNTAKHVADLTADVLLEKSANLMTQDASLWIIWTYEKSPDLIEKALRKKLYLKTEICIYGKPQVPVRKVMEFTKNSVQSVLKHLTIRDASGNYTEEYKKLTIDFHNRPL